MAAASKVHLLILGGTQEARHLAEALRDVQLTYSVAGRTRSPQWPEGVTPRCGGFGGAAGLAAWLTAHDVMAVIDATHPFAAQISRHAAEACRQCARPLLQWQRPPWRATAADSWYEVPDMRAAAAALGEAKRRVLLTIGRQELASFIAASQHRYWVRSIEPPEQLPLQHTLILQRGPFDVAAERTLMQRHAIEVVVTKNAGGTMTQAKLQAAAELGVPVIMVQRPALPQAQVRCATIEEVRHWLRTQGWIERGV